MLSLVVLFALLVHFSLEAEAEAKTVYLERLICAGR